MLNLKFLIEENLMEEKTIFQRHLPHYQFPGYTYFISFRLAHSLPAAVVQFLRNEYEKESKRISTYNDPGIRRENYKTHQAKYFLKYDQLLDSTSYGPVYLKDDKAAGIVSDALHFYDNKDYDLLCYTIMPNHVHLVFAVPEEKRGNYIVSMILQKIKRYTALKCNQLLNRTGQFWHQESYDHIVRNEQELNNILKYVVNNPVKAKLCETWEEWKWTYIKL
jgi:putative transposase